MEEGEGYETYETQKEKQIRFFQDIADRLKTDQMSSKEHQRWSEFYMSEKMASRLENECFHLSDEKKLLKYFTLGWFLYEEVGIQK